MSIPDLNMSKKRSIRSGNIKRAPVAPLTQDQVDALVEVVEGELRGLFLLILLTRRPAMEIVRLRRDAVVPLVKHLMEYFVTAHCTAESDALLFPGLAALPPYLLFPEARSNPGEAISQLPKIIAETLAKFETTAQAQTRMTIQGRKVVSATHRHVTTKPRELARRLKKRAGKTPSPGR